MGQGMPLPAGAVRMAVPMRWGEQAQWPVSTVPIESLEAAAQEWYRFRDSSWGVKLYNHHGLFLTVVIALMVLLGTSESLPAKACQPGDTRECHTFQPSTCDQLTGCVFVHDEMGGGFCTPEAPLAACEHLKVYFGRVYVLMFAFPPLLMGLVLYLKCQLIPRLKDEANSRLAVPVNQALAGTGWSVKAYSLVRNKGTQAPEGLRKGCCSPGWIWLEFVPYDSPVVGAPPAVPVAQPLPANAVVGFVVEEPGVARARELQPVLARLSPLLAA